MPTTPGYPNRFWDNWLGRKKLPAVGSIEPAVWIVLVLAAGTLRLVGLGERAMSHDEAQHVFFAYDLVAKGTYHHDPITHGPFLFHLNALLYWLLGTSDTVARLGPALAGTLVIAILYLLRPVLGRGGALASGLMLTISPSFLFYSRYIRNDIYIALFSLAWIYSAWRYVETRERKWLLHLSVWMALAFATKETSFIFGALIGSYFLIWSLVEFGRGGAFPVAPLMLSLTMASLVSPFLSPLVHLVLDWPVSDYTGSQAQLRAAQAIPLGLLASVLIPVLGEYLLPRSQRRPVAAVIRAWIPLFAVFGAINLALFTTLFTNLPGGLISGLIGSLGYWLSQQGVGRGDQPVYYYGALALLYESLPLLLALLGATGVVRRLVGQKQEEASLPPSESASGALEKGRPQLPFLAFLLWWTAGSFAAYSAAGEKMPWLLTQIVLPMCLLGGWWAADFIGRIASGWNLRRTCFLVAGPIAAWALGQILFALPFQGMGVREVAETTHFFAGAVLLGTGGCWGLLALLRWRRDGVRTVLASFLLALLGLNGLWSFRLAYRNYDLPTEFLLYAHGTPDIKRTVQELQVLQTLHPERKLTVGYDDETTWPMGWYLRRDFGGAFYGTSPDPESLREDVLLLASENDERARQVLADEYRRSVHLLIWWPRPVEEAFTIDSYLQRTGPPDFELWPYRKEFAVYVRRELLPETGAGTLEAAGLPPPLESLGGVVDGLPLQDPKGIEIAPDGSCLVADSGNHRILIFHQNGKVQSIGSECSLIRRSGEGCEDPDGQGPLASGDGQFDEPWGVTCDSGGRIYVADTWNGRIQAFDASGRFLRAWGHFSAAEAPKGDPLALFGPRDLEYAGDGTLLVADTGNRRLLRFDLEGNALMQNGGAGSLPGRFEEPAGLACEPDGRAIYIAEAGNRRVQVMDHLLKFSRTWAVPEWNGRQADAKPYLAIDPSGRVIASDPANDRLLAFPPDGSNSVALIADNESVPFRNPTGVAYDHLRNRLLVVDSGNHRILVYSGEAIAAILDRAMGRSQVPRGSESGR